MDWLPTFLAAAGKNDIKEDLLDGYKSTALGRDYKIHLDGYDLTEHLKDPQTSEPAQGDLLLLRRRRPDRAALPGLEVHLHGAEDRRHLPVWMEPFVPLRVPLIFNLRRDPYERATITSNTYYDWLLDRAYLLVPAQAYVGKFLADLQGLPAAPEGRQLLARQGDGEDAIGRNALIAVTQLRFGHTRHRVDRSFRQDRIARWRYTSCPCC